MTRHARWLWAVANSVLLLAASPARAQVSVLGKGFVLDEVGSLTSSPGEVISGRTSIKGSYSGPNEFTSILISDPTFIRLEPNQTYTITLSYRILAQGFAASRSGSFRQPEVETAGSSRPPTFREALGHREQPL